MQNNRVFLGAMMAVGLMGCAPAAPAMAYRVCFAQTFTPAEVEAGLGAIDDWTWNIPQLKLTAQTGGECGIENGADPTIDVAPGMHNEGTGGLTFYYRNYDREYGLVTIDTWLEGNPGFVLQQVFAHEFGHAMGLVHTGPGTIMCWSTACQPQGVSAGDIAQWWSIR
jgi:Matrixin